MKTVAIPKNEYNTCQSDCTDTCEDCPHMKKNYVGKSACYGVQTKNIPADIERCQQEALEILKREGITEPLGRETDIGITSFFVMLPVKDCYPNGQIG